MSDPEEIIAGTTELVKAARALLKLGHGDTLVLEVELGKLKCEVEGFLADILEIYRNEEE